MYLIVPHESNYSGEIAPNTKVSHWPFVIGRGDSAHLQLDLPGVWERHIALDQNENGEICFSCTDQSEVWLNGKAVCQYGNLIPGDMVTMGPISWRLELAAPQVKKGRLTEWMVSLLIISAFMSEIWLIYRLLSEF